MKYDKEDYRTPHPGDLEYWRQHMKYRTIQRYKHLFRGVVADFGCAHGVGAMFLAELPDVEKVVGVDLYLHGIEKLPDNEHRKKIEFIKADLRELQCFGLHFDAAICFHTLEHIYKEDMYGVLLEMYASLKPRAPLITVVPKGKAYYNETHVTLFDHWDDLRGWLEHAGFRGFSWYIEEECFVTVTGA